MRDVNAFKQDDRTQLDRRLHLNDAKIRMKTPTLY